MLYQYVAVCFGQFRSTKAEENNNDKLYIKCHFFFCCGAATQRGSWPPHSRDFLDHTQRRTTVGRTPLDE